MMTNEDWKYRIVNASPKMLVIVTYEIILDRLDSAATLLESGDSEGFRAKVNNAKEFVSELRLSLDLSIPVAGELSELYIFVNRLLTKAYFLNCAGLHKDSCSDTKKFLQKAEEIVRKLMVGLNSAVDDYHPGAETTGSYSFSGVFR